ncbi:hypothetical protein [Isachenkonia alkalipeptolytica]|uniref:Uncharacterized protein n=1 Tax=Isachenkonia alkalipeptolytica TaxID=2565777 RepID=A0AA43XMK3_9CLOT|nr:hypothetical protein [Isachenkonia alkalipeptolytica]NBG89089.1 hypothetical protein [Isachenkonia alkalipeptolytica]
MEHLQNLLDYAQRYITVELFILIILIIGTFLIFAFLIQDVFQDYFKDYGDKKKREREEGKAQSRPRVVKTPGTPEEKKKKGSRTAKSSKAKGKSKLRNNKTDG